MNTWKNILKEESGIGTIEVILILVVLIGIVIIFKTELTTLIDNIFNTITSQTGLV